MRLLLMNFLLMALVGCTTIAEGGEGFKNISAADAKKMLNQSDILWMDVRTPGEIEQGKIEGATVFVDFNGGTFEKTIETLDKTKTYVVYCRSGGRSSSAAERMTQKGFKSVYNLTGGISAWDGPISR